MGDTINSKLQAAIAAARQGNKSEARNVLIQIIKTEPKNENAWLWLSAVMEGKQDRIRCLQQVISINPDNEMAQKGLAALGVSSPEPGRQEEKPTPEPPQTQEPVHPIPLPSIEDISRAQKISAVEADRALSELLKGHVDVNFTVKEAKTKKPSTSLLSKIPIPPLTLIAYAMMGIGLFMGGIAGISLLNSRGPRVQTSTTTYVVTPRVEPTAVTTRTPTPTGLYEIIDPAFAPGSIPRGDMRFGITPSPVYINTPHPSTPELSEAITFYHEKNYENAIDLLEKLEQADEESIEIYYYLAMSYIKVDNWEDADLITQKGLSINDAFAPLYVSQGLVYQQYGSQAQAEASFQRAKDLDSLLLESYIALANLYMSDFRFEESAAAIDDAYSLNRYNYNVSLIITEGELALKQGEFEEGLELGQKAYYIDPSSEEVNLFLAEARIEYGAVGYAVVGLEDYLYENNLGSGHAWSLLGRAYGLQGRQEDAYFAFQRALQLSENVVDAVISRAEFNFDTGNYQQAFDDLSEALLEKPRSEDLLWKHAIASFEIGEYEAALEDIAILREKTTLNPEVEVLYIRSLIESEQYERVLNPATDALNLGLTNEMRGYVLEASGRTFLHLEQYPEAERDMTFALNAKETGARYFYIAQIYAGQNQYWQAIRNLEWVLYWDEYFEYSFGNEAQLLLREYEAALEEQLQG